ncbi:MAG TPA: DUF6318 family protein [Mycobacteriales bacterium]|nr:DUF6318 family protein [Mycobacteriales bacterium]
MTASTAARQQRPAPSGRRRARRRLLLVLLAPLLAAAVLVAVLLQRDDPDVAAGRPPVVEVDLEAPTTKPALPAEQQQPTVEGARDFALFWFDALNWSLANADADLLAGHTNGGCRQCTGWLLAIARWRDGGDRLEGGLTVPVQLAIGPFSDREPVQFAATFLTSPATVTSPDGAVQEYPGGRTRGGLTVLWANGRWQMTDVVLDAANAPPQP